MVSEQQVIAGRVVTDLRERIDLMESTAWGTWGVGYSQERLRRSRLFRCPDSDRVVYDEVAFFSCELNLGTRSWREARRRGVRAGDSVSRVGVDFDDIPSPCAQGVRAVIRRLLGVGREEDSRHGLRDQASPSPVRLPPGSAVRPEATRVNRRCTYLPVQHTPTRSSLPWRHRLPGGGDVALPGAELEDRPKTHLLVDGQHRLVGSRVFSADSFHVRVFGQKFFCHRRLE